MNFLVVTTVLKQRRKRQLQLIYQQISQEVFMQLLALIMFVLVASFGSYLFNRRRGKKPVGAWMAPLHGIAGVTGFLILLAGIIIETWNDWSLIALTMFAGLLSGAFIIFRKLMKGRSKPLLLIAGHGAFAIACIGVLMYSLILPHYA